MKKIEMKHYVWAERYRPQTIDDVILPETIKEKFKSWVQDGQIPNLGFWGNTPGLGKTSLTNALIKEINTPVIWINASKDGGIDNLRSNIKPFASSGSEDGRPKIVVLDEADNLTSVQNGAQYAIRGDIEEYAKNCRFILTGNYKEKLIKPVLNRLSNFDFDEIFSKHKKELGGMMYQRLKWILENEKIEYDASDIQTVIKNFYPSVRGMIGFLQSSVVGNKLCIDGKYGEVDKLKNEILTLIKNKDFKNMLKQVNDLTDPSSLFTYIYKHLDMYFEDDMSQPRVILLLSKYMDYASRARDEYINVAAFCTECMKDINIKFKG